MSKENLTLWEKYAQPPAEATKPFSKSGFSGTDISPLWRIRCLTEEFGPCGIGWYVDIAERWTETVNDLPMVFVTIKLFVKTGGEWSMPIISTGGNSFVRKIGGAASDEAYKMAYTDALGGACKMLGIGGAVYWEQGYSKYESDYTDTPKAPQKQPANQPPQPPKYKYAVLEADLDEFGKQPDPFNGIPQVPGESWDDINWRTAVLQKIPKQKLDKSCINNWGTDFDHTPVSVIKTKLKI